MGARLSTFEAVPIDDFTADVVLLIETIEHLDDKALQSILHEILLITKRGGYIAVTTPNEENLAEHQVICPNCGCVFHTVQHMRSFSADSLSQVMQVAGFTEIVCRPTLFSRYPKLFRLLHRVKYKLKEKKFPHLLYIGQKLVDEEALKLFNLANR
ncbi:MAG TPA: methyltransferase domain-containing protein [Candidatus Limnocylindrales bacterium]|nr:methyltransferase domain-containing protein [Candidatus Limnocylindrales bacterium]